MAKTDSTDRSTRATRAIVAKRARLKDQGKESDLASTTAAERWAMMWQLALDAWAFKGEPVAESRLPRHIVRVLRRGR
jgi:hypothetical protein